jgi:hypothetical protein
MIKRKMTAEDASNMFPIGTEVKYFPIFGENEFKETKIRSQAWALGHGELVIKVEDISGGVAVSHLEFLD